ncbi:MAG: hypothetical protein ACE5F3_01060 [Mariprofundaceae bacterium]
MAKQEKPKMAARSSLGHEHEAEQGFVLITVIVLLAILTIIGIASLMKSNIEIQVSSGSVVSDQAAAAAGAGLAHNYAYWSWNDQATGETADGQVKRDAVIAAANAGTATAGIYNEASTGTAMPTDAVIQGSTTAYRVYNISSGGLTLVANNTWATVNTPQVAVWATRFNKQTDPDYPYNSSPAAGASCSDCNIVVYALGRAGVPGRNDARSFVREVQMTSIQDLEGVDAITNAPQYATWMDACHETASTGVGSALSWGSNTTPDVMIEATQSPYKVGAIPSGTAMSSNANMGGGGKMFRNDVNSSSELTMDSTPLIAYSLHNTASGVRVKWADTAIDAAAADDPDPKLTTDIMLTGLSAGTDKMDYFLSGNAQLFKLDAYRWAAEQFTCQDAANPLAANGEFCAKAEALRIAMGSPVPVTGRLTLEQFEKNVQDGRPMFGIVRVLWPTTVFMNTGESCESAGGRTISLYDLPSTVNKVANGRGQFHVAGPNSKVIVYGMFLMDYFTDNDNDFYFDADTERLIEPIESVDAYLKVEMPLMVNPTVPYNGGAGGNFYTIAPTTAPAGSTNDLAVANRVNQGSASSCTTCRSYATLASPYDGWFPSTEGMVAVGPSYTDGSMALMDLTHGAPHGQGLIGAAFEMENSGGTTVGTLATSLFSTHRNRLNYYYELMYTTTDQGDTFSWPITTSLPATFGGDFYIGAADAPTNDGDKFHLLFPNGYVHGIKAALVALNITADEWNNVLSGNGGKTITDLATAHSTLVPYGDATNPLGSPFGTDGTVTDPGIADAATIQADQSKYFSITKDATSGYGIIDSDFKDLPALDYSGGLIDTHSYSNIGGILYTPGPLEWEPGNKGGLGYVAGSVITGFGIYNKSGGDKAHQVYVFDAQAADNISIEAVTTEMRRHSWENLL